VRWSLWASIRRHDRVRPDDRDQPLHTFTVLALGIVDGVRDGVATTARPRPDINALVHPLLGLFYLPLAMLVAMKRRTLSAGLVTSW
jgi:hypothetical protein